MKVINNPCFIDIGRGSSTASLADITHKRMYWLAVEEPPRVQESISSGGPVHCGPTGGRRAESVLFDF